MKIPFPILLPFLAFGIDSHAQTAVDSILVQIEKNNKTIIANTQLAETQKLHYKTGLTPYNPSASYDFMKGTPGAAGNQTDIAVTQSFDFPTAYIKKNQLSQLQIAQATAMLAATRQEVLLSAKITCMQLIYRNKLHAELSRRKQNSEKLLRDFQTRLHKGEGNILDVNKARLQLIETNRAFLQNSSLINQLNQQLTELNGGVAMILADTLYPGLPGIPPFEHLAGEIEKADPVRKQLEQQKLVAQKQVEVSRALTLPKLEAGYRYQGNIGQEFNGLHTGITIPLWENKNTVKTQQANLLFCDLKLQAYINEIHYKTRQLYEQYENLKITISEYQLAFSTLNTTMLLYKAFSSGQISSIEYFLETGYYYNAYNHYLQTENEYNEVVAKLFGHRL